MAFKRSAVRSRLSPPPGTRKARFDSLQNELSLFPMQIDTLASQDREIMWLSFSSDIWFSFIWEVPFRHQSARSATRSHMYPGPRQRQFYSHNLSAYSEQWPGRVAHYADTGERELRNDISRSGADNNAIFLYHALIILHLLLLVQLLY